LIATIFMAPLVIVWLAGVAPVETARAACGLWARWEKLAAVVVRLALPAGSALPAAASETTAA
jgi:hypothetical protein